VTLLLALPAEAQTGAQGTWVTTDFSGVPNLIDLQVAGSRVTGTISRNHEVVTIYDGSVAGGVVTFKAVFAGGDRTITYTGRPEGGRVAFTRSVAVRPGGSASGTGIFGGGGPMAFTATRDDAGGVAVPRALFGNWKANLQRSTFDPGPPPGRAVPDHQNLVSRPGGSFGYMILAVGAAGTPLMVFSMLKADGRDYPRHTAASLAALLDGGAPTALTVSMRVVDDRTFEWTHKNNGVVTSTVRSVLSPDGNTWTETARVVNAEGQVTATNTWVFERIQPAVATR
jgi:hypothetical protein